MQAVDQMAAVLQRNFQFRPEVLRQYPTGQGDPHDTVSRAAIGVLFEKIRYARRDGNIPVATVQYLTGILAYVGVIHQAYDLEALGFPDQAVGRFGIIVAQHTVGQHQGITAYIILHGRVVVSEGKNSCFPRESRSLLPEGGN
jgi:hypothetical protein